MSSLILAVYWQLLHILKKIILNIYTEKIVEQLNQISTGIQGKKNKSSINYANITYACVHGGKTYKNQLKGMLPTI